MLGLQRATFVGHDTGGGVALILGIEHPDRVDRLVLTNAVAYDSWPTQDLIALGDPQRRDKPAQQVAAFAAGGLPDGFIHTDRLTPEFAEGIVAPWSDAEGALSLIRHASALNTNHTMELVDGHGSISAPTLVLWGVHDVWQPPSDARRLAHEIPDARLVEVDASHWIPPGRTRRACGDRGSLTRGRLRLAVTLLRGLSVDLEDACDLGPCVSMVSGRGNRSAAL